MARKKVSRSRKSKSRGSLLGRSSKSSNDKTGLYLFLIIGIVVAVGLFLSYSGEEQVASGDSMTEESSALAGQAWGKGKNVTVIFSSDDSSTTGRNSIRCDTTLMIDPSSVSILNYYSYIGFEIHSINFDLKTDGAVCATNVDLIQSKYDYLGGELVTKQDCMNPVIDPDIPNSCLCDE